MQSQPIAKMKIKFFTTGGTIDKVYFDSKSEFEVGSPTVLDVLKDANVAFESECESILRKDSLDISDSDRQLIRDRVIAEPNTKIIITPRNGHHASNGRVSFGHTRKDNRAHRLHATGQIQVERCDL